MKLKFADLNVDDLRQLLLLERLFNINKAGLILCLVLLLKTNSLQGIINFAKKNITSKHIILVKLFEKKNKYEDK